MRYPYNTSSLVDPSSIPLILLSEVQTVLNPYSSLLFFYPNKCFQYPTIVALKHEETGTYSEKITKITPFINENNWEGVNYDQTKIIGKT